MNGSMLAGLQPGGMDGGAGVGTVLVSYPAAILGPDPFAITGVR